MFLTNQLPNIRDALRVVGDTPTDASATMGVHRLLSSAMRSNDDNDWPVHSLMLSLHDLRDLPLQRLPSAVHCVFFFDLRQRLMTTDMAEP